MERIVVQLHNAPDGKSECPGSNRRVTPFEITKDDVTWNTVICPECLTNIGRYTPSPAQPILSANEHAKN